MFLPTRPSNKQIEDFLTGCEASNLSYREVGTTEGRPPAGYNLDHNRIFLGSGDTVFDRAKTAVREWQMFNLGWVELYPKLAPIEVGQNVAILVKHFGFYSLNSARIVYTLDSLTRFGFAYGTLIEHGEIGEERFSVEFDQTSGEVWYDLYAFSRPAAFLAKLGYPLSRYLQKAFASDSKTAMVNTVNDPANTLT